MTYDRPYAALEEQVIDDLELPLDRVPDSETELYDARSRSAVTTRPRLRVVGRAYVKPSTPIEIKTCLRFYDDTHSRGGRRRGRWHITRDRHYQLVDRDGWYLLAVRNEADRVLSSILLPASDLEPFVSWTLAGSDDPYRSEKTVIRWADLIETEHVEGGVTEGAA